MADQNVKKAQVYLNAMFGGNSEWVHLEEDGITGTATIQGIVRAFQIHNNVGGVTGSIGPATMNKMKSLAVIKKMKTDDTPDINVCLIQCALFCKGYAAGGITGIYYNSGVAAVKKMQEHAGLTVTGEIDWKVWSGLLSLNWFTLVSGGNSTVRTIQQQLNEDWSDVVGVGPCDGVVSRQTALSLVGALQAAEGVTTELILNLNSVNFGNATTAAFPSSLKENQNSDDYVKYNKIAQYGLYFNGYDPGRYDGIFDAATKNQVSSFQEFYGLTGINLVTSGEINVSTMKSLLTSKGDVDRKAKACDCSTILNTQQAADLKNAGYLYVGRYLTGTVGTDHKSKALTLDEITAIKSAGLSLFPIYQDGGYELDYFKNTTQGCVDAETAIAAAKRVGIPEGTTIYFAVDFDCYGYQVEQFIVPYFKQIKTTFNGDSNDRNYKIGIYAPRYVCTAVAEKGYTSTSFVSDMSTGFSCNLGYSIPKNWAFDQFHEMTFSSSPSFGIDKDGYSGRDNGCSEFDTVNQKTEEELIEENQKEKIRVARNQFTYNVLEPLGYYDELVNYGFKVNKEIPLDHYEDGILSVAVSTKLEYEVSQTNGQLITVAIDNDGNLEASCENQIMEMVAEAENEGITDATNFKDILTSIALSIKTGIIEYKIEAGMDGSVDVEITAVSPDIIPDDDTIEAIMSVSVIFKITVKPDSGYELQPEQAVVISLAALAAVTVACGLTGGIGAVGLPALLTELATVLQSAGLIATATAG